MNNYTDKTKGDIKMKKHRHTWTLAEHWYDGANLRGYILACITKDSNCNETKTITKEIYEAQHD